MPTFPKLLSSFALGAAVFAAVPANAQAGDAIVRTGKNPMADTVTVPSSYDTVYVSGQGVFPDPKVPYGNTETQSTQTLEKIKKLLADQGLTLGDIVMMHAYVAIDPKLGKADTPGWNAAYARYFGTPELPNKPARSTIVTGIVIPGALIEIEVIAARKRRG